MMQQPGRDGPMAEMFGGLMPQGGEQGRWGDYVFNQEGIQSLSGTKYTPLNDFGVCAALDQIITQIMENSAAHPVPATDEIMEKLPREVLEEGSSLLDKDCAVCKEQFKLGTEDPDEQIIVTLPCKHPFHESCIMPWLKSSGTCPVCRFQLIPQPEHHAPGPGPPSGSSNNNGNGSRSPGAGGQPGGPGGFFDVFMNHMRSGSGNPGNTNNHASNRSSGGSRVSSPRRSSHNEDPEVPGGWHYMD
ncbi:hypothetical protein PHLCEN_2v13036 [Hermanssonia centrifuga]|uniref:RING-type domain-containing protein n=1 Tax=Hermanssonia centrifuga TaxID=98765 RepID=A0A2R6NFA1_9APHY|nr:hypothetical protein PHLCEN_2v13036 [Hermanssonia centrifuga]